MFNITTIIKFSVIAGKVIFPFIGFIALIVSIIVTGA